MSDNSFQPSFATREVIRESWQLTRENWKRFASFVLLIIALEIILFVGRAFLERTIFMLLLQVAGIIAGIILSIAMARLALSIVDRHPKNFNELFAFDGKMILSVLVAAFLMCLAVTAGLILLIIPGLIIALMFCMYMYPIVDKNAGPLEALKTSAAITKGNKWRIFLFGLYYMLLAMVAIGLPLILFIISTFALYSVSDQASQIAEVIFGFIGIIGIVAFLFFASTFESIGLALMYRKMEATRHSSV